MDREGHKEQGTAIETDARQVWRENQENRGKQNTGNRASLMMVKKCRCGGESTRAQEGNRAKGATYNPENVWNTNQMCWGLDGAGRQAAAQLLGASKRFGCRARPSWEQSPGVALDSDDAAPTPPLLVVNKPLNNHGCWWKSILRDSGTHFHGWGQVFFMFN